MFLVFLFFLRSSLYFLPIVIVAPFLFGFIAHLESPVPPVELLSHSTHACVSPPHSSPTSFIFPPFFHFLRRINISLPRDASLAATPLSVFTTRRTRSPAQLVHKSCIVCAISSQAGTAFPRCVLCLFTLISADFSGTVVFSHFRSSVFFSFRRNRLESNTEHWNALLLSLRELIEWVIRKDTELTGLGPVCGDVAALQKQEVSSYHYARLYREIIPRRCVINDQPQNYRFVSALRVFAN